MLRFYFLSRKRKNLMPRRPMLIAFLLCSLLGLNHGSHASDTRHQGQQHYGDGFAIDLDEPYDKVLQVVKNVSEDGVVRGSSEYKGMAELYGAAPGTSSKAFRNPPVEGTVIYKVRAQTLAPEHFLDSNDVGTVTVRYVVRSLGSKSTHLAIDAIFQEDSHHHYHPSDGTVENAEFLAIADEIKDINDKEAKDKQEAEYAAEQKKLEDLLAQLDDARAQLKAAKQKEQDLTHKVQGLSAGKPGQVRTATAELKAEPNNESKTLTSLAQGDSVTILLETRSWYRVQASNGQQGWVYRLMLEAQP